MEPKKKPNPAKEKFMHRVVYLTIEENLIEFAKQRAQNLEFPSLHKYINHLIRQDKLETEQRAVTA